MVVKKQIIPAENVNMPHLLGYLESRLEAKRSLSIDDWNEAVNVAQRFEARATAPRPAPAPVIINNSAMTDECTDVDCSAKDQHDHGQSCSLGCPCWCDQ